MNIIILLILFFIIPSSILSQEIKSDEEYYKEGVQYYDGGEFKKSFIVFFNLSEKGNKDANENFITVITRNTINPIIVKIELTCVLPPKLIEYFL